MVVSAPPENTEDSPLDSVLNGADLAGPDTNPIAGELLRSIDKDAMLSPWRADAVSHPPRGPRNDPPPRFEMEVRTR